MMHKIEKEEKIVKIKRQMIKVNKIAIKHQDEIAKLHLMCEAYYGDENYGDNDLDDIIDALDMGIGTIRFKKFDRCMRSINARGSR